MKDAISFELIRSRRKTIAIHVYPGRKPTVRAPFYTPLFYIEELVRKRSGWILKKQNELELKHPATAEKEYITGDSFWYRGRQIPCQLKQGPPKVHLAETHFILTAPDYYTRENRKKLMLEWYRREAKKVFAARLEYCLDTCRQEGIEAPPEWTVRNMKRRWGSCRSDGKICLNIKLLKAPVECIDYVIIHELCHRKEHNHSRQFYSLLGRICPGWKELQKKLNQSVDIRVL